MVTGATILPPLDVWQVTAFVASGPVGNGVWTIWNLPSVSTGPVPRRVPAPAILPIQQLTVVWRSVGPDQLVEPTRVHFDCTRVQSTFCMLTASGPPNTTMLTVAGVEAWPKSFFTVYVNE